MQQMNSSTNVLDPVAVLKKTSSKSVFLPILQRLQPLLKSQACTVFPFIFFNHYKSVLTNSFNSRIESTETSRKLQAY